MWSIISNKYNKNFKLSYFDVQFAIVWHYWSQLWYFALFSLIFWQYLHPFVIFLINMYICFQCLTLIKFWHWIFYRIHFSLLFFGICLIFSKTISIFLFSNCLIFYVFLNVWYFTHFLIFCRIFACVFIQIWYLHLWYFSIILWQFDPYLMCVLTEHDRI